MEWKTIYQCLACNHLTKDYNDLFTKEKKPRCPTCGSIDLRRNMINEDGALWNVTLKNELRQLIQERALITGSDVKLSSGLSSTYYFDLKQVTMLKRGKQLIAWLIWDAISSDNIDAVGGMESGAIPIVDAIIDFTPIDRGFYVKKEPKKHGSCKFIEGSFRKNDTILIVEDVATTGGSTMRCIERVQELGGTIARVFVIVDRLQGAREALAEKGFDLEALFTRKDFGIE